MIAFWVAVLGIFALAAFLPDVWVAILAAPFVWFTYKMFKGDPK